MKNFLPRVCVVDKHPVLCVKDLLYQELEPLLSHHYHHHYHNHHHHHHHHHLS